MYIFAYTHACTPTDTQKESECIANMEHYHKLLYMRVLSHGESFWINFESLFAPDTFPVYSLCWCCCCCCCYYCCITQLRLNGWSFHNFSVCMHVCMPCMNQTHSQSSSKGSYNFSYVTYTYIHMWQYRKLPKGQWALEINKWNPFMYISESK